MTATPRDQLPAPKAPWRHRLHEIIFEADTPGGKLFDVALLLAIGASIVAVMLESVDGIRSDHGFGLRAIEWVLTILFTIEYLLRAACVRRPGRYMVSFYGVVDLLAILPTYISLFVVGTQSLIVIRALRLLRVFRVFKLAHYLGEANQLHAAMRASQRKITVFLGTVLVLVCIIGAVMYLVEGPEHGFSSIPRSVYWAIVTMTTVGYGDVTPQTIPGQVIAACVMVLGYGIIAVPTGIVSVELAGVKAASVSTQACRACAREGHAADARFCKYCGEAL